MTRFESSFRVVLYDCRHISDAIRCVFGILPHEKNPQPLHISSLLCTFWICHATCVPGSQAIEWLKFQLLATSSYQKPWIQIVTARPPGGLAASQGANCRKSSAPQASEGNPWNPRKNNGASKRMSFCCFPILQYMLLTISNSWTAINL